MNVPFPQAPLSPQSDENAMRWRMSNQRPRLQTEETLRVANFVVEERAVHSLPRPHQQQLPHHVHTMSQENPFVPTDDELDDLASTVSSVSNDSLKRYRNWVRPAPGQTPEVWTPFVPPKEIFIRVKMSADTDTSSVPDWLKSNSFDLADHQVQQHPLFRDTTPPKTMATAGRPMLTDQDHWRNKSWDTKTTINSSAHQTSVPDSPAVDRPQRRHRRRHSTPILVGALVGQSSLASSAPDTVSSSISNLSLSGCENSFAHLIRANRKLDELVASEAFIPPNSTRRTKNPLKEEVLYVLDKVSSPVKRLVKTHHRSKSYDLHASEHGCLA